MQFPHALSSSGTIFMSKILREREKERERGGQRETDRYRKEDRQTNRERV